MLGGLATAEAAGLDIPSRNEIYARISDLPEGRFFRPEDIIGVDEHLRADFAALRGYDYIHMADGWFIGVVETSYLRRLPKLPLVIASYASLNDCTLVETGDWIAWRAGIKQWEPILGYRYYTDGPDDFIAYTRFGTRILNAPDWLRLEDDTSRLLRAYHDTPLKEMAAAVRRTKAASQREQGDIEKVIARAREIGPLRDEERARWEWLRCPIEIAQVLEECLDDLKSEKEAA